jgi:hypothetical protein
MLNKRPISYIDRFGITFPYKGDEVTWIFPWKRDNINFSYLSTLWGVSFITLKDLDKFNADYDKEMSK